MTRPWTLAESRLIAERVMEWQVFEFRGRLVRVHGGMVPEWPHSDVGEVLAAIQRDGWRIEHSFWTAASHTFTLRLRHPITKDVAEGVSSVWSEAVVLAVLAAVENR
jgi:hypothetical protein